MNEQKQIKEMTKELSKVQTAGFVIIESQMDDRNSSIREITNKTVAKALYNKGYRKQREGKFIKATPYSEAYCNQCGLMPKLIFGKLPPYCPNCGAKME